MNGLLFRGKRNDNGEWVQSCCILRVSNGGEIEYYLADTKNEMEAYFGGVTGNILSITECDFYRVNNETVCRSIGQHDKTGRLLFEHDIVKLDGMDRLCRIFWLEHCSKFALMRWDGDFIGDFEDWDGSECLWIGNYLENPEAWGSDAK